jgi:hypothetical protein
MVTLYDIQASLKTFLEQEFGIPCVWIYDGVELPSAKPFLTVEDLQTQHETLDKMREVAESTYRFQIGVFAQSSAQKAKLPDEIKRKLSFSKIPLIDTSQPGTPSVGYFIAEVGQITPIPNDDISNKTNNHRAYLDVSVEVALYK